MTAPQLPQQTLRDQRSELKNKVESETVLKICLNAIPCHATIKLKFTSCGIVFSGKLLFTTKRKICSFLALGYRLGHLTCHIHPSLRPYSSSQNSPKIGNISYFLGTLLKYLCILVLYVVFLHTEVLSLSCPLSLHW